MSDKDAHILLQGNLTKPNEDKLLTRQHTWRASTGFGDVPLEQETVVLFPWPFPRTFLRAGYENRFSKRASVMFIHGVHWCSFILFIPAKVRCGAHLLTVILYTYITTTTNNNRKLPSTHDNSVGRRFRCLSAEREREGESESDPPWHTLPVWQWDFD